MGWKPYFLKIQELYPELIAYHCVLKDKQYDDIKIGGIGGSVEITDVMQIKLPYMYQGKPASFLIGLTDDLPVTCLIGLPFHQNVEAVFDISKQTVYTPVLNTEWKILMKPPHRKPLSTLDHAILSKKVTFLTKLEQDDGREAHDKEKMDEEATDPTEK